MNERFLRYLRFKKLSQKKLCELSSVPQATVSRFCNGNAIMSDALLRLLQVCDDLSLEWFFYGTGEMIRSRCGNSVTNNYGAYAGADVVNDKGVLVKDSRGVRVSPAGDIELMGIIAEKDRIILQKDTLISERDRTISELYQLVGGRK